ncbi:MAG: hypothetical protein IPG74_02755 [Flavobacteriales bacterium]|nr:hypothetical protein [Flavobacteriales bacterium]
MPPSAEKVNSYSLVSSMVRDTQGRYWFGSVNGLYHWQASDGLHQLGDRSPHPARRWPRISPFG